MALPSQCPNCQAPMPESLERFGTNCYCKICGQILRDPDPLPVEETRPRLDREVLEEDSWDEFAELPPVDQLLSDGWGIFQKRMGLCVGVTVLVTVLNLLVQSPELVWTFYLKARVRDPLMRDFVSLGINLYALFRLAFSIWMSVGQALFMLKIARGQRAEVSDLFRGGVYFWRALLCSIVMGLAVLAGAMFCIVPGVMVALMLGQFLFVLIDENLPGLESLRRSYELTQGKKLALFLLLLVCFIINLFGVLALFVGTFFTSAYTSIVVALAYDRMSGRPRQFDPSDEGDDDT